MHGHLNVKLLTFTYLLVCLLTYLLTPRSRVLLEKLTVSQLVSPWFGAQRQATWCKANYRNIPLTGNSFYLQSYL